MKTHTHNSMVYRPSIQHGSDGPLVGDANLRIRRIPKPQRRLLHWPSRSSWSPSGRQPTFCVAALLVLLFLGVTQSSVSAYIQQTIVRSMRSEMRQFPQTPPCSFSQTLPRSLSSSLSSSSSSSSSSALSLSVNQHLGFVDHSRNRHCHSSHRSTVPFIRQRTVRLSSPSTRPLRQSRFTTTSLFSEGMRGRTGAKSAEKDLAEWKAIVLALKLYKAAYGDLKVPKRFVVPSMAPWPESAWGIKLGQKVASIRETGLYLSADEMRREQLDSLGFVWRLRAASNSARDAADFDVPFGQIYDALVVYRNEIKPSGPLTVPLEFTVPDSEPWPTNTRGLPLGRTMEALKSKSFLEKNPGAVEKLREIGFETDKSRKRMSANDKRFQAVYDALLRYKEIYGDLLVPQPFVIPDNSQDWPEECWGMRLGARVNAIRSQGTFIKNNSEREELLDALGFVWSPPEKDSRKKGRRSLDEIDQAERRALEAQSRGTTSSLTSEIPTNGEEDDDENDVESFLASFDFSDSDADQNPFPFARAPVWGLEEGREDGSLPDTESEPSEQELEEEWEDEPTLGESLSAARERALEAGIIENRVSKRPQKRNRDPDIPWFNDDFGGDFVFEDVVEALTLYKQFFGDFSNLTDTDFVIPVSSEPGISFDDDDFDFDDDLSMKAAAIEVTRFDQFEDPNSMTDDQIEAQVSKMEQEMFAPAPEVGVSTLSPISEVEWPEHLEGMRLGNIVMRIRDGSLEVKHLPERKEQLDAIGFDWGDPKYFLDVPFEKAMCAMYSYYLIRGDMFVPTEFIMPDQDPWPSALAGYELGLVVKRVRELQNFFEAFHTEKVSLLRMIDFVWFPTLALPIDPNEGEMTSEMLLLGALGHPDYADIEELPMGLPEKIIAGGPFFQSDDPRQWWREWHNWDYVADIYEQLGPRDNAHRLRKRGYTRMGDEHEDKYGPGLVTQIVNLVEDLTERESIQDENEKQQLIAQMDDLEHGVENCYDLDSDERWALRLSMASVRAKHCLEVDLKRNTVHSIATPDAETMTKRSMEQVEDDSVSEFEEEELDDDDEDFEYSESNGNSDPTLASVEEEGEAEDDFKYEYEWVELDELGLDAGSEAES